MIEIGHRDDHLAIFPGDEPYDILPRIIEYNAVLEGLSIVASSRQAAKLSHRQIRRKGKQSFCIQPTEINTIFVHHHHI